MPCSPTSFLFLASCALMALVAPGPAWATDPSTLNVDLHDLPDLLEHLRQPQPLMGTCPLGEQGELLGLSETEHLLHQGTVDFYLDRTDDLGLTRDQQRLLGAIRSETIAQASALARRQSTQEEFLWTITGSANPDLAAVRRTLEAIEALRTEQRMLWIEALAKASALLTPNQRATLLRLR